MAKIQEYFDSKLDLGPSAAVAYLDAWVDTRAGLNRQLMDAEGKGGADPSQLAEQEAKIRDAAGKLARKKADYQQAIATGNSDLARTIVQEASDIYQTIMRESGATTRAQLGAMVDVRLATKEANKDLNERLTKVDDPNIVGVLANSYDTVATAKGSTGAALVEGKSGLKAMVDDQLAAANLAGMVPTRPEAKAIVQVAIAAAERAGDHEAAQALAEAYGAAPGQPWAEFARASHPEWTEEDVGDVLANIKQHRSGGTTDILWDAVARVGGLAPGSVSVKEGGSVAGTPSGLDKAIADMEAAADDLQAARHAAMAAGTAAFRPRPNWMITNPNQYTDTRDLSALRLWGRLPREYVEEVSGEVQRQRGNAWKAQGAISERGGLSVETAPEYDPSMFTGITLPDHGETLARNLEAGQRVSMPDGWTYEVKADNTIKIVNAPGKNKGAIGKVLKPGDKFHAEIAKEVAPQIFAVAGPSMPLYGPALARAEAGDFAGAVKAARAVTRDDQNAILGEALVKAARGERPLPPDLPPEIQERVDALSRLSPANKAKGLERLGKAVLDSYDLGEREKAAATVEAREVKALRVGPEAPVATSYEQGREAAREMARALGDAAPEKGAVEWIRGQLNKRGSAFDSTRSEYERGIVEEINAQVETAAAPPSAGAQIPAAVGTMPPAVRPAPDKPLAIGGTPPGGVVKSPDMALEAGGATAPLAAVEPERQPSRPQDRIGLPGTERERTSAALAGMGKRASEDDFVARKLAEKKRQQQLQAEMAAEDSSLEPIFARPFSTDPNYAEDKEEAEVRAFLLSKKVDPELDATSGGRTTK